jgi:molybdopterin converting factor small subunit
MVVSVFISISFLGLHRKLINSNNIRVRLTEQIQNISDLFKYLNDKYPELPLNRNSVIVTVNNVESSFDYKLKENDEVLFMPHIGGG